MRNITDSGGGRNSVYPPAEGLTFFPFIYMVPQYRPDDVLMLGYAGGTTAGLIKMLYGETVPITAVDVEPPAEDFFNVRFVLADAESYVKTSRKFDAVIVDVFDDGSDEPCGFVTDPSFVAGVKAVARYVIVHAKENTHMDVWGEPLKVLSLNRSRFHYYMVERVGRLLVR